MTAQDDFSKIIDAVRSMRESFMRRFTYSLIISLCCLTSAAFAQGRNLTVLVNADTHFGAGILSQNRACIQAMNGMAGAVYPAIIGGGVVGTPRGVIVPGDLTESGLYEELDAYLDHYPLNGGTGLNEIHYPVKECTGNHDCLEPWNSSGSTFVCDAVVDRQGALNYSWDWDGVHFASLDLYPTISTSTWLANDLASLASQTPVVLFSHYGYEEWHRAGWANWNTESTAFLNAMEGHNVIALIHGHDHCDKHYTWEGYDVYTPGSPKDHNANELNNFGVMNITDDKLTWAEYGYQLLDDEGYLLGGDWKWTNVKQIVPEPATISLLGVSLLLLVRARRR